MRLQPWKTRFLCLTAILVLSACGGGGDTGSAVAPPAKPAGGGGADEPAKPAGGGGADEPAKPAGGGGVDEPAKPAVTTVTPNFATIGVPQTFTIKGTHLPLTAVATMTDATCDTPTARAAEGFTVQCAWSAEKTPGNRVVTIKTNTDALAGEVIGGNLSVDVRANVSAARKLNDTGITDQQCFVKQSSDELGACSSANPELGVQDGHIVVPMSFSKVPGYELTECVKDDTTGLMWEGKPASGTRGNPALDPNGEYTNYHTSAGSTEAEVNAADNSMAYVKAVNAAGLCGFRDWRMPTASELQNIVDYGRSTPSIDPAFPNTKSDWYWTATALAGSSSDAWLVVFGYGGVVYGHRDYRYRVRLVRASQ